MNETPWEYAGGDDDFVPHNFVFRKEGYGVQVCTECGYVEYPSGAVRQEPSCDRYAVASVMRS